MSDVATAPASGRAVQYLRMSTEHQRYSLENQAAAIADYALMHGLHIQKTYADEGKSGLDLKGRKALQNLLSDALSPTRTFDTILVLDVSRWGRFQDPDQSAYYEFLVRQAGVQVCYCGELFENDGGVVSNIVKQLKRVMAAEYSRELSAKVTRAKLQQARLGFRQGGVAPYGFRRLLASSDGTPRHLLQTGQRKWLHEDRVYTVPGPPEEQAVVRKIFQLLVSAGGSFTRVAQQLNEAGVRGPGGRAWGYKTVAGLIRNELCVGDYVYNRAICRMRQTRRRRPSSEWVRVTVGPPIVNRRLFDRANALAGQARVRWTEKEMLKRLSRLLAREGRLSPTIIDEAKDTPTYMTYVLRFGSISRAYDAIGYSHHGRHRWNADLEGWWTNERILEAVRRLHLANGYVSRRLLATTPGAPSPTLIHTRFGGLLPCYAAAGLPATQAEVFSAALSQRTFRPIRRRGWRTNAQLLDGLRELLAQAGSLSERLIAASPLTASVSTIRRRFGSIAEAYALIGYDPPPSQQAAMLAAQDRTRTAPRARTSATHP